MVCPNPAVFLLILFRSRQGRNHRSERGSFPERVVPSSHFSCDVQELSLTLGQWFSSLNEHQNRLEGSLIHRWLGATPRVSESIQLQLGLRICISNTLPSEADAADPRTTLTL